MSKTYSISSDFPDAAKAKGREQWLGMLEKLLGDKTYEEKLCHKSEDGFLIDPAPTPKNLNTPYQKLSGGCVLSSMVDGGTAKEANADLLADLAGGAGAVHVVLDMFAKRGRGIVVNSQEDFNQIFADVYLEFIPISIDAGQAYTKATEMLMHLYQAKNIDPEQAKANLNIPITKQNVGLSHLVSSVNVNLPNISCVAVDGASAHNAGASAGQELAFMLASGVAALRCLEQSEMSVDKALGQISFRMAVDSDVFLSMAKIRSLRHMWGEVLNNCGAKETATTINVETSRAMMSSVDIETNILRTTSACFAGLLGGADSICVLPYDVSSPSAKTHNKARRVARNIAVILDEEGFLTRTQDVAAGSYSIETVTEQLSQTAWQLFQKIEADGGIDQVLNNGTFASLLMDTSTKRKAEVESGERTIIGVNAFLNPDEKEGE